MIDGKEYHSNLLKSTFEVYPEPVLPTLTPVQIFTHTCPWFNWHLLTHHSPLATAGRRSLEF